MKIFHLSDLHIGIRLFNRDLKEDQAYIFHQIISCAKQEKPDAIVIAGDIYDKAVPSAEAVELFDWFITGLKQAIPEAVCMMISGNHDSAPRVNTFRKVLSGQNLYMIGNPPMKEGEQIEKVLCHDEYGDVVFYLLPFVKPSMIKQIVGTDKEGNNLTYDESLRRLIAREKIDENRRNVLVSHQFYLPSGTIADQVERMDSEICTVGNIDQVKTDLLDPFDYVALGHIHKPMNVGKDTICYCGTPLAYSVSEAGQEKSIVMVELKEKGEPPQIQRLPLKPLRQVKILKGTLEQVLSQECADYVTVVLEDKVDLDVVDMKERLLHAFPNLLEIRREIQRMAKYQENGKKREALKLNPYQMCEAFLGELNASEEAILKEVVNQTGEVDA